MADGQGAKSADHGGGAQHSLERAEELIVHAPCVSVCAWGCEGHRRQPSCHHIVSLAVDNVIWDALPQHGPGASADGRCAPTAVPAYHRMRAHTLAHTHHKEAHAETMCGQPRSVPSHY